MKKVDKKNLSKKVKLILSLFLVIFLFIFFWTNRSNFAPVNLGIWLKNEASCILPGQGFPLDLGENKVLQENFKLSRKNLVILGDSSFVSLSASGRKIFENNHNFENPCLKTSGLRSIIYDLGGKKFKIESLSKSVHTDITEENITCGAISESGIYCLVTRSKVYPSELRVFDVNNKEKYRYCFSDYYVTDAGISENSKQACVSGVNSEGGKLKSEVYILDFKSETPKLIMEIPYNFLHHICFFENGNVLAVGNKYASVINPGKSTRVDYSFENMELQDFDFNKKDGACFCLSTGNFGILTAINSEGTEIFKSNISENVESISYFQGKIAVLTQKEILIYNLLTSGKKSKEIKAGFKKVLLTPFSRVYLLGTKTIETLNI